MKRAWLLLLLPALATADEFDAVRARIRAELRETNAASIAVAVARNGQIVWEEGFGWADREKLIPATQDTLYSLASISKPFTATALMALVERGLIRLDAPMDDYLGNAKLHARIGQAREATVRRVASHSAGLPLHYQFFYADEPYHRPPMDETILRYANLVTPPGERYQYSNLGYGLLDYAIARASGRDYPAFMRTEIFLPLGLNHTSVGLPAALAPFAATRYTPAGNPLPMYDFDHPGGSALWASAHDLVRFGLFHLKERLPGQRPVISSAAIDEMQRPVIQIDAARHYGLGWYVSRRGEFPMVAHNGAMGGVATVLRLLPAQRLVVAVLSNDAQGVPDRIADQILQHFLAAWPATSPPLAAPKPFTPRPELTGVWIGAVSTYQGERTLTLDFKPSGFIHARLGSHLETLVNDAEWNGNVLTGQMLGDLATADTARRPYTLELRLALRGRKLNGSVTAVSVPADRRGNGLSHWVELEKAPAPGEAFRISPLRPIDQLRREALLLAPPVETGKRAAELVEVTALDPAIKLDIRYAGNDNFLSTPIYESARAFLQKPAAQALARAHRALKALGFGVLIHDAYRPWFATKIFWEATPEHLRSFVANPAEGSIHNRGCAVDLTLYHLDTGKSAEMPSAYDEMTPRAYPDYAGGTALARYHRALLRRAMEAEGFTVYPTEWWHYNYKDWAQYPIGAARFADIGSQ